MYSNYQFGNLLQLLFWQIRDILSSQRYIPDFTDIFVVFLSDYRVSPAVLTWRRRRSF